MDDEELKILIRTSKEEGYCELVKKYKNYVNVIVSSVLKGYGTEEDTEECICDVFVKLVMDSSWARDSRTALKAFIGVTARNTAIDTYRKLSGRSRYITDDELDENISSGNTPETYIHGKELRQLLWENVRSLGEPDSEIITAQYLYGRSVREIAAVLKMSVAAVHKRSRRARKKLEKMLMLQLEDNTIRKEDFYETGVY